MTSASANATTSSVAAATTNTATAAETKQAVFQDIRVTWGKFSEQDMSGLKDNDDLVAQLAAKYGLNRAQAQRDVDAFMHGRRI